MLNVLIILVILIGVILFYAKTKPDSFRVQRSIAINATPEKIFPHINNLAAQSAWSPFEKDPQMKKTLSGSPEGKGQIYEWQGNRQVGAGRIQITDSRPPSYITLQLEMFKPFKADNIVEFTLAPEGSQTIVTWAMHGPQPYMGKVMSTFINCDNMVGKQFEQGLAKLKAIVES